MLKERVVTALVLAAVLLGVMLGLPPVATVWLLTVLVLIGAWEWAGFIGKDTPATRAAFTIAIALALVGLPLFLHVVPGLRAHRRDDRGGVVVRRHSCGCAWRPAA